MKLFKSGGNVLYGCSRDKETGDQLCFAKRRMKDGSEVVIGQVKVTIDGQCTPVADSSFESEPGVLDELERRFISKMKGKCDHLPSDY